MRTKFVRGDGEVVNPLIRPLFNDVAECEEMLDHADTQFVRRALVRAAYAFSDGYLYWIKKLAEQAVLRGVLRTGEVDLKRLSLLSDHRYRLDHRGIPDSEANRFPFPTYAAFVIRTVAECCNVDPTSFFSDNGWNEMKNGLKVRHRITHPKKPEDLDVTDEELYSVSEGLRWLLNCTIDICNDVQQRSARATGEPGGATPTEQGK